MPVYGFAPSGITNIALQAASLAVYASNKGRITYTKTMDEAGSGTIEAIDVPAALYGSVFRKVGDKINLFGDSCYVESFGYTASSFYPNSSEVKTYNVSTRVKQEKDDIKIWKGKPSGSFFISKKAVDGENTSVWFEGGYNKAELTWGTQQDDQQDDPVEGEPRTIFRLKASKIETFTEGDDEPDKPPVNTYVLRDLSSNFDESGPKKMRKVAKRVNGQLDSETITTYGFAYTTRNVQYADVFNNEAVIYDAEPANFWQPIEYKQTQYFYEQAGSSTFTVTVRPPGSGEDRAPVRFLVHPDYTRFAQPSMVGSGVSFRSNAEYLVRQVTTGWKLVRFVKEPNANGDFAFDFESDDPWYPLFNFIRIPFYSETLYALRSSRREFGEDVAIPFRIEWTDYKSLSPSMKMAFASQDISDEGKVAILYPDPNYVEPMFIESESTMTSSFDWRWDPDGEIDPDNFVPGTSRVAPAPRFTTGEESFTSVRRKIVSNDRYTEYIVNYSSQDPGFDNSAEVYSFREASGTPPEPQYRIRQYQSEQVPNGQIMPSSIAKKKYFITCIPPNPGEPDSAAKERTPEGGSVNVPTAKNKQQASDQVALDLLKAYLKNSPCSVTSLTLVPSAVPGAAGNAGELLGTDASASIVTSLTHTVEFNGTNNITNSILVTGSTQFTLGPTVSLKPEIEEQDIVDPQNEQKRFDESLDINIESTPSDIGRVFPNLPNRRNF